MKREDIDRARRITFSLEFGGGESDSNMCPATLCSFNEPFIAVVLSNTVHELHSLSRSLQNYPLVERVIELSKQEE